MMAAFYEPFRVPILFGALHVSAYSIVLDVLGIGLEFFVGDFRRLRPPRCFVLSSTDVKWLLPVVIIFIILHSVNGSSDADSMRGLDNGVMDIGHDLLAAGAATLLQSLDGSQLEVASESVVESVEKRARFFEDGHQSFEFDLSSALGFTISEVSDRLVVKEVQTGGVAWSLGMNAGVIIEAVDMIDSAGFKIRHQPRTTRELNFLIVAHRSHQGARACFRVCQPPSEYARLADESAAAAVSAQPAGGQAYALMAEVASS